MLRASLSRVIASPAAEKGVTILANLSLPLPVPTRLWKRFALCEALLFLWCGKGIREAQGLSRSAPVAGASLEALSLMRSIPLPLVRARGAHCKTACARPKGKTKAIHWRGTFGEWTPSGKANAISLARPPEGPSPMAEPMDRSRSACKPFRSARPVRAPKEEHWQSTWQSASKDAQAQARWGKGERFH